MTRAKSNTVFRQIRKVGVRRRPVGRWMGHGEARKNSALPTHSDVRAVRYQRKGFQPQNPADLAPDENATQPTRFVTLYHERWEIELWLRRDQDRHARALRRLPAARAHRLSRREMWGILTAYNLVRLEIERIADELGVLPIRISFVAALRFFARAVAGLMTSTSWRRDSATPDHDARQNPAPVLPPR